MNTLLSLFWESTRIARFLTLLVSILGAVGIWLRSQDVGGDLQVLFTIEPWWVWSGLLLTVAFNRYWCLWWGKDCLDTCLSTIPSALSSIVAIVVWSTVLTSAYMATDFGLALMIIVCDILEFWLLTRVFYARRKLRSK